MSVLLQASAVTHHAGDRCLFEDLEIAVSRGDRLGLVGHNGCGKTTLLGILGKSLEPDAGDMRRKRDLRCSMVEQFLPPDLAGLNLVEAVVLKVPDHETWRAEAILSELGFSAGEQVATVGTLSGGQENRLMFARAMVGEPELLLLDEPTNHLDLSTLLLFERYLESFVGAFIVVSHDRAFLDAVTRGTLVLRDQRIYRFDAGYSDAMKALHAMDDAHARTRAAEERKIESLRASAKRLATWGHVYDNEDLSRRAKSMEKRVERMEADRTFVTSGSPLDLKMELGSTRARQVLSVEDYDVAVPGRVLFHIERLLIRPGERVALLGRNGAGKTTLIRHLVEAWRAESDSETAIAYSPQTTLGYYDQELDEVSGEESLLMFVRHRVERDERTVRGRLISAGFGYEVHSNRISSLSGGERARLLFVVHALNQPNFLVMDEPTNHIDIEGKEQLETQLIDSGATLLITSHDRRFLETVANRYLLIGGGGLVEITQLEQFYAGLKWQTSLETDFSGSGETAPGSTVAEDELSTGASTAAHSGVNTGLTKDPTQTSTVHAYQDEILEEILALEQKLSDDLARKPKFQKPKLQAEWHTRLEALYAQLND